MQLNPMFSSSPLPESLGSGTSPLLPANMIKQVPPCRHGLALQIDTVGNAAGSEVVGWPVVGSEVVGSEVAGAGDGDGVGDGVVFGVVATEVVGAEVVGSGGVGAGVLRQHDASHTNNARVSVQSTKAQSVMSKMAAISG